MKQHMTALFVTVEEPPGGYYSGWNVKLNGEPLWFRPYDGSDAQEAAYEVFSTLREMLRERKEYLTEEPEDDPLT
jgi:hypothetical protein